MAVALTLIGCTTPTPKADTKSRHTEAAPLFATEEEALAAAEEAYARYVAVSDLVLSEGGREPERIRDFVTGRFLTLTLEGFEEYATKGYRSVGNTVVTSFELQQFDPNTGGEAVLIAYACQDISAVDVIDSGGLSVVAPSRPATLHLEVTFDVVSSAFMISEQERWTGAEC